MQQFRDFADDRLLVGCIYCGGRAETREHVPSKAFLDAPLPENLPIVGACRNCNNGFSGDEEYLVCLVESVIAGAPDPEKIQRKSVARILERAPALAVRLAASVSFVNGRTLFSIEPARVRNIVTKLAQGHAAYELSLPCKEEPKSIWWSPLALMDEAERDEFESCHIVEGYGEIGSRGMQRLIVAQFTFRSQDGETREAGMIINDWVTVQDGRYRYHAIDEGDLVRIKMVISEYLACEVIWES